MFCVLQRDPEQEHLKDGHLALSGLQVRGHAMFSLEGFPLDSETMEYAWLIEVIVGEVTGKLSTPQVSRMLFSCLYVSVTDSVFFITSH